MDWVQTSELTPRAPLLAREPGSRNPSNFNETETDALGFSSLPFSKKNHQKTPPETLFQHKLTGVGLSGEAEVADGAFGPVV